MRLNLAAFRTEYSDMQLTMQDLTEAGIYESVTANAGKSTINGAEIEAKLLVGDFTFNASIGYLDAGFDDFFATLTGSGAPTDNSNLPLAFAPDWTASLGGVYELATSVGTVTLQASATYTDDMYTSFTPLNATSDLTLRKANILVDATVALTTLDGHWRFALWGKNLTDKHQINNTFPIGPLFADSVYGPPRTWAAEASYRF